MKIFQRESHFENKANGGYTLIEVLLVMTFTSISFMALYAIFAKTIQGNTESRNEIIAPNLAQECIERVRNCRDNEVLDDSGWSVSDLKTACEDEGNLSFDSGGKTFNSTAEVSMNSGNAIVTCTVSWDSFFQAGLTRKVEIKSLLSDWQKQ